MFDYIKLAALCVLVYVILKYSNDIGSLVAVNESF